MLDGDLRIPKALHREVEQIIALTDRFCAEHLDQEYGALCRRLVAKLARKRPSPLERGDLRIWAAAAIHTVGTVNFLFSRDEAPHLSVDQLSGLMGVSKSTMANKAKQIRTLLKLAPIDTEFCRRALIERHPYAWLVQIDGITVDARMLPAPMQEEARRRGLIPDLDARGAASHR